MKDGLPTSEELQELHTHMMDIATRLDYFGGFSEWATHGTRLAGVAVVIGTWAEGMKEREKSA